MPKFLVVDAAHNVLGAAETLDGASVLADAIALDGDVVVGVFQSVGGSHSPRGFSEVERSRKSKRLVVDDKGDGHVVELTAEEEARGVAAKVAEAGKAALR